MRGIRGNMAGTIVLVIAGFILASIAIGLFNWTIVASNLGSQIFLGILTFIFIMFTVGAFSVAYAEAHHGGYHEL